MLHIAQSDLHLLTLAPPTVRRNHNVATIRGWLLYFLIRCKCGYYSEFGFYSNKYGTCMEQRGTRKAVACMKGMYGAGHQGRAVNKEGWAVEQNKKGGIHV